MNYAGPNILTTEYDDEEEDTGLDIIIWMRTK
jgi:hypothetical protein